MIGSLGDCSPDTEPDPPVSRQVVEVIQHLQRLAINCGGVMEVVTRNDVEEAWQAQHEEPSTIKPFTDEMRDKFQKTYTWRHGLSRAMWDGVWESIQERLNDIEDPSFGRIY